jgi:transcriptional regulator with XRE-family HTH domain
VDVRLAIKQRLEGLGLEQRDLAAAVQVTESYISQLLTRKKAPPATDRTDLYERMNAFLRLPKGQLSAMVEAERREELKKKFADPPAPLFKEVRELVIRTCKSQKQNLVREIFEKQSFGELERLVSQTLLDVVKGIAKKELENEKWLRKLAEPLDQTYEELRTNILEFLDTDIFNISPNHCSAILSPLIDSWDIDLKTFGIEVALTRNLTSKTAVKFQFVEMEAVGNDVDDSGFQEFLRNRAMSGDAAEEEIMFLKSLRFKQNELSALYYYRELQNLRDPLHFRGSSFSSVHKRGVVNEIEKGMQLDSRKRAIHRWAKNKNNPRKKNNGRRLSGPSPPRTDAN